MSNDRGNQDPNSVDESTRLMTRVAGRDENADGHTKLKLPGYQVIRELGRGGMGQVFLARQLEPVEREVAVKLVKRKLRDAAGEVRFLVERQALAQMHHPAIAQIFEAGTNPEGFPYFAMEYVRGEPLLTFCNTRRLDLRARLGLFVRICYGISHAHQKGIIHRDLKPANILVTEIDDTPQPKIIDFGIAAAESGLKDRRQDSSSGTPVYMSPEQFDPDRGIDIRTDIYSLGVVLCELLCDLRPHPVELFRETSTAVIRQRLAAEPPLAPSRLLQRVPERHAEIAAARATTMAKLHQNLQGPLDAIALKAMHSEPEGRYGTALELADEVTRYLERRPVRAMGNRRGYRLRCFLARNAWSVAAGALVVAALGIGLALALVGLSEARRQQQIAETRSAELERVVGFQQSMLGDLEPRALGEGFVQRMRAQVQQALDAADGEAAAEAMGAFERAVGQINPTDLAQDLLDEFMIQRAMASIEREFSDQPHLQADLYATVRDIYYEAGMVERSLPLARRVLELRRDALGPDATATLQARQRLYRILFRTEDFTEAGAQLDEIFARMDPDDPAQLELRFNAWDSRANLLVNTGDSERALETARAGLARAERELGPHHAWTARALNTLGYVHALSGRLEPALQNFRQSLERARGYFEPTEETYYSPLINVGAALSALGRLEESLPYQREAYEILSALHGQRNDSTLRAMSNLAMTLVELERYDEAIALHRRAFDMARDGWGPHAPLTLTIEQRLVDALLGAGRVDQALAVIVPRFEWNRRSHGESAAQTIDAGLDLLEARIAAGYTDRAAALAGRLSEALADADLPERSERLTELQSRLIQSRAGD